MGRKEDSRCEDQLGDTARPQVRGNEGAKGRERRMNMTLKEGGTRLDFQLDMKGGKGQSQRDGGVSSLSPEK